MLKPEQVTLSKLQQVLRRAVHPTGPVKDGWIEVREGLRCIVWLKIDTDREFIKLATRFNVPHLDKAEIAENACRMNADYFLVKFIAGVDSLGCCYELPYGEGLNSVTLIRLMRRLASISIDCFETLPKPLADMKPKQKQVTSMLH